VIDSIAQGDSFATHREKIFELFRLNLLSEAAMDAALAMLPPVEEWNAAVALHGQLATARLTNRVRVFGRAEFEQSNRQLIAVIVAPDGQSFRFGLHHVERLGDVVNRQLARRTWKLGSDPEPHLKYLAEHIADVMEANESQHNYRNIASVMADFGISVSITKSLVLRRVVADIRHDRRMEKEALEHESGAGQEVTPRSISRADFNLS
jgi:hypothetical protein